MDPRRSRCMICSNPVVAKWIADSVAMSIEAGHPWPTQTLAREVCNAFPGFQVSTHTMTRHLAHAKQRAAGGRTAP
jgi:hypothetical protein